MEELLCDGASPEPQRFSSALKVTFKSHFRPEVSKLSL